MKPSHLAALCLAGLGVGGMTSAAMSAPLAQSSQKATIPLACDNQTIDLRHLLRAPSGIQNHRASWHKLSQRQIRKNRRRAHAAGRKCAFA